MTMAAATGPNPGTNMFTGFKNSGSEFWKRAGQVNKQLNQTQNHNQTSNWKIYTADKLELPETQVEMDSTLCWEHDLSQ